MTLHERLKQLRRELGISQEAFGAQGFISAPGWIKIENGERSPSEKLIDRLVRWLVHDKYIRRTEQMLLREELLTLKHLGSRSEFVRAMAANHARQANLAHLLVPTPPVKPRRGRPPGAIYKR